MRHVRRALLGVTLMAALGILVLLVMGAWYRHQWAQQPVERQALESARERTVQWLTNHEGDILADGNSALWQMIKASAEISGDPRLASLTSRYMEQWMPPGMDAQGWRLAMQPDSTEPVDLEMLPSLSDYQQFLMFGLSCDSRLLPLKSVREHLEGHACPAPLLWALKDSTCSSHQMLGLMYIKQRQCAGVPELAKAIEQTRQDLGQLLWWDFRVRDVYIQRALALWWIGLSADVKPDMLARVLAAQLPDGGWSDQHVLTKGPDWYLAMGGRHGLTIEPAPADFHVTAQALLLVDLALRDWPTYAQAQAKNNAP